MLMDKVKRKRGRPPKKQRAIYQYSVRFNEAENARFDDRFLKSGIRYRSWFIKKQVLEGKAKIIHIDPADTDFYIRLTNFYAQFAAIGRNYTQVVEDIRRKFGDRRAASMLTPLAKATIELVKLSQIHKSMTEDFRTTVVDYHWNGNK